LEFAQGLEFIGLRNNTVYINSIYAAPKPGNFPAAPAPQSTRLLGKMRERLRYLHYSLRTEQTNVVSFQAAYLTA
jgi:hypothetical protein